MEVSRPQTTVESLSGQRHTFNERGKLVLRRQGKEGIRKRNRSARRAAANRVQRWSVNRSSYICCRRPRKEDSVASAQNQSAGIKRRVGKTDAGTKIIWIDAGEQTFAYVRHVRQIVLSDDVSRLHKTTDRRSDRITAAVDFHSGYIKRRIES